MAEITRSGNEEQRGGDLREKAGQKMMTLSESQVNEGNDDWRRDAQYRNQGERQTTGYALGIEGYITIPNQNSIDQRKESGWRS